MSIGTRSEQHDKLNSLKQKLQSQPTSREITETLQSLMEMEKNDTTTLEIISMLINTTIPQVYELLDIQYKAQIVELFNNRIGISQLIIKLKSNLSLLSYSHLLADIIKSDNFHNVFNNLNRLQFKEIKALVNHKIIDILNAVYLETRDDQLDDLTKSYRSIIFYNLIRYPDHIESTDNYWQLMNCCLQSNSQLVNLFFQDVKVNTVLSTQYSKLQDKLFFKTLIQSLKTKITPQNINGYSKLINDLNLKDWSYVMSVLPEVNNVETYKVIVCLCSEHQHTQVFKLLTKLLSTFGSREYIQQTSIVFQELLTALITVLIHHSKDEKIMELSKDLAFLDAISHRLESNVDRIRSLGMIVGDLIYERLNNGKPMFNIDNHIQKKKLFISSIAITQIDYQMTKEEAFDLINSTNQSGPLIPKPIEEPIVTQSKVTSTFIDSDPEDSDDEGDGMPTVSMKKTVPTPVYLKELVLYLQADKQKDQSAFSKHEIAFHILPQLVRSKAQTAELKFHSKNLLEIVMELDNPYDFKDFETWKLSSMISITTGDFTNSVDLLIKSFINGDLSLNMRIMILSCLSLSSRELAGFADGFIPGKNKIENIGPQKLPEHLHQQFILYEPDVQQEMNQIESAINSIEGVEISGGTVTRMSAALTNRRAKGTKTAVKSKDTTFINTKLPKLFFTLISVWQTVNQQTANGFNIGHFSPILNAHFLRTLSIILECAIPSSVELIPMISEMIIISIDQLRVLSISYENGCFESVLRCLNTIFQVDSKNVLKNFFVNELMMINDRLMFIYSSGNILDKITVNNCGFIATQIDDCLKV